MIYPALLTDVNGAIIPQYYDGSAWQPYEDKELSTGTTGLAVPSQAVLMGYKDSSGNLQPFNQVIPTQDLAMILVGSQTFSSSTSNPSIPLTPTTLDVQGEAFNAIVAIIDTNNSTNVSSGQIVLTFTNSQTGSAVSYKTDGNMLQGGQHRQILSLHNGIGDTVTLTSNGTYTSGTLSVSVTLLSMSPVTPLAGIATNGTDLLSPVGVSGGTSFNMGSNEGLITASVAHGINPFNSPSVSPTAQLGGALATPQSGVYTTEITTAATTIVKNSGPTFVGSIVNNGTATTGVITVYDNASNASGTKLWSGTLTAGQVLPIGMPARYGIVCVTASANDITVSYA